MARRFGKLGWFLGLIFGTIFGVLFAPRKGKELRDHMKKERKKGKLGIAPLQDDLMHLGRQIATMTKDFYDSEKVQDIVEKGRKKFKDLSDDFVGDVADFHKQRIRPLQQEMKSKMSYMKSGIKNGKSKLKKAGRELNSLQRKVKESAKVGKHAFKEMKKIMKKKSP